MSIMHACLLLKKIVSGWSLQMLFFFFLIYRYRWKRNEIDFNPSGNDARVVQLPNVGTLVINSPEDKDEGIFQCFAINSFGTSASKKINLRQAKLEDFAYADPVRYYPRLGEPFTLPCVPPESVPPASVFWINKLDNGGIDVFNYDDRVSMDRECKFSKVFISIFCLLFVKLDIDSGHLEEPVLHTCGAG